jgi:hypothetical protein
MKIQFIARQDNGSSFHRLVNPMSYIRWNEGDTCDMLWHGLEEGMIDCDLLVYGHYMETDAKWLGELKKNGTKIVVDVDDWWELPSWLHGKEQFDKRNHTQRVIDNLRAADLVTCTTIRLQEKVREYNKNTVVIPNAIPYGYENFIPNNRAESDKMRFIYVGGAGHYDDVKSIEGKLKRIGSDGWLKDRSKYIVAGYRKGQAKRYYTNVDMEQQNENYAWVQINGIWDKITAAFGNTGVCEVLPALNPADYITHYDHGDVSLIPLMDREWNHMKSPLKFAEAASRNLPVLCSKVAPYTDVTDVKGVIWVESNDWYHQIKKCVKNPTMVQDMGLQLAEYCKDNYDLLKWGEVRKQVYESLI